MLELLSPRKMDAPEAGRPSESRSWPVISPREL